MTTTPLLSFAYESVGPCLVSGANMFLFTSPSGWKMGPGSGSDYAIPGSGASIMPTASFYIRKIGVTTLGGTTGDWVLIGHSGPNGDWVTPKVLPNQTFVIDFDATAAPLFTVGGTTPEYLDAHQGNPSTTMAASICFWWVPA